MPHLEYESRDKPSPSDGYGVVLIGLLLGLMACGIYAVGRYCLRDHFVGRVEDSHYEAWLYSAPLAGAASAAGGRSAFGSFITDQAPGVMPHLP